MHLPFVASSAILGRVYCSSAKRSIEKWFGRCAHYRIIFAGHVLSPFDYWIGDFHLENQTERSQEKKFDKNQALEGSCCLGRFVSCYVFFAPAFFASLWLLLEVFYWYVFWLKGQYEKLSLALYFGKNNIISYTLPKNSQLSTFFINFFGMEDPSHFSPSSFFIFSRIVIVTHHEGIGTRNFVLFLHWDAAALCVSHHQHSTGKRR